MLDPEKGKAVYILVPEGTWYESDKLDYKKPKK